MDSTISNIERLKAKIEDTDRDFGRLKLRSHSKFNKVAQLTGELREIEILVNGFNSTLIQSKHFAENKVRTVDNSVNENKKTLNQIEQTIRNLERQVVLYISYSVLKLILG